MTGSASYDFRSDTLLAEMPTPKRPQRERPEAADVFPYYAGFSYAWASMMVQQFAPEGIVLDPWNGSGTTTLAASTNSVSSIGVDLSPAANMVARARLLGQQSVMTGPRPEISTDCPVDDPLLNWLDQPTASRFRAWEIASREADAARPALVVGLFRALRSLTRSFEGSNPTWVKVAKTDDEKVHMDRDELDDLVDAEQKSVRETLLRRPGQGTTKIIRASAVQLPIQPATVDAVIGSPPYLTRIDYAVAYSRELAVIGLNARRSGLRQGLMGTTMIRPGVKNPLATGAVGVYASQVLHAVESHESKESAGYYSKQARQYIADLHACLRELTRVASAGCQLALVLQDSYYKEVHIDLPRLAIEALRPHWELLSDERVRVPRLVTTLNSSAQGYDRENVRETVLKMRRLAL